MATKCSSCGKKLGTTFGEPGVVCKECGYVYCGNCAGAGMFSYGECPRCGGKCKKN